MRTQTSQVDRPTQRQGFGPRRLAMYATAHPKRVLAVWVLIGCYALLGPRIEPLVTETLGVTRLAFLRPLNVLSLMSAGTLLGGLGGWLARGRPEP